MNNPLFRLMLRLSSSERIDMQEDYVWIRKAQKFLSKIKASDVDFDFLDNKIYSTKNNHEIPVRIFYPEEIKYDESIIYIHGGGWVLGNIDTYSVTCMNIANKLNRIVYSIDYRLAPENPYPDGLNDCFEAIKFLMNIKKHEYTKWTLMGDSAGGNLVSAVLLKMKEENIKFPENQILLYPLTYWEHTENSPFESVHKYGENYGLTNKKMQEYMEMYEPDINKRKIPTISPLMAKDLSSFPDTLVITAEYDLLRDEGEAFAAKLKEAGNYVECCRIKDAVHGFITYSIELEIVQKALDEIEKFLND